MNLLQGKVVVLTGGTSGIGEASALQLAAMGARLVLVARDPQRAESILRRLLSGIQHTAHIADLSLLGETKRVGQEIAAAEPRIDVLINNAGVMSAERQLTADGLELTFATNHLAYFVLTQALLPRLIASAPARIINTASEVHRGAHLDLADLQSEKRYSSYGVYGKSKLANVLFTRELARRLAATGVTVNCLHPGVVASRFAQPRNGEGGDPSAASYLASQGIAPEKSAEAIVYLATSPDLTQTTGQYFNQSRLSTPSEEAQDDATAKKLWRESEQLAGIHYEIRQD
ncbi:MAG TPA: SDR family oxidoreductase [Bryobacteraceae bacterium]|nr:SDR family oxidoreductase [Bryobacteraceae bacterium]